jgi:hypothetical protein
MMIALGLLAGCGICFIIVGIDTWWEQMKHKRAYGDVKLMSPEEWEAWVYDHVE